MKLPNGSEVTVRQYQERDVEAIVNLIRRNFLEVNVKDYGEKSMKALAKHHDINWFKGVASYANVYVFCIKDKIVGVGAISSFWGSLTESILLTIFVLPELHGNGIGRYIVQILERDELFLRADRIEIPASITAVEFYKKQGYDYKNGIHELDDEGHYRLEKFNNKKGKIDMVRFAQEKDLDRINELRKQVNDIHVEGRPDIFKAGFGTELRDYAKVLINGEDSDIIVAECDGIICGMACIKYVNKPETPHGKARCFYHVIEIAVDANHRRQGVAKKLFEFMIADAKKRKLGKIELDVWEFNDSAIEFYQAVGFRQTRRWMEYEVE